MEKENDLMHLKRTIRDFAYKYDIKDMIIDIEDRELEVCPAEYENTTYKKVTITLEY